MKRRRTQPLSKRVDWENSPAAHVPVAELIKRAEREAQERASQIQRASA